MSTVKSLGQYAAILAGGVHGGIYALRYLDGELIDDDEAELKIYGIKYKYLFDVGGWSSWHNG